MTFVVTVCFIKLCYFEISYSYMVFFQQLFVSSYTSLNKMFCKPNFGKELIIHVLIGSILLLVLICNVMRKILILSVFRISRNINNNK